MLTPRSASLDWPRKNSAGTSSRRTRPVADWSGCGSMRRMASRPSRAPDCLLRPFSVAAHSAGGTVHPDPPLRLPIRHRLPSQPSASRAPPQKTDAQESCLRRRADLSAPIEHSPARSLVTPGIQEPRLRMGEPKIMSKRLPVAVSAWCDQVMGGIGRVEEVECVAGTSSDHWMAIGRRPESQRGRRPRSRCSGVSHRHPSHPPRPGDAPSAAEPADCWRSSSRSTLS